MQMLSRANIGERWVQLCRFGTTKPNFENWQPATILTAPVSYKNYQSKNQQNTKCG